jgi:hypothetical protein
LFFCHAAKIKSKVKTSKLKFLRELFGSELLAQIFPWPKLTGETPVPLHFSVVSKDSCPRRSPAADFWHGRNRQKN